MNAHDPRLLTFSSRGGNWLTRALLGVLGLAFAVIGFFFLTVAIVAGAFLALAIAIRWWWTLRRIQSEQKTSAALEGEYQILEDPDLGQRRLER